MPNHVTNHLHISGPETEVRAFLAKAKGNDANGKEREFTFNAFVPTPPHIFQGDLGRDEEEKYGKENCWYGWNIQNWGTKWDAYEVGIEDRTEPPLILLARATEDEDQGRAFILFETAWSEPTPVIRAIAEQHPKLRIIHKWSNEDYCADNGVREIAHGKILSEETYTEEDGDAWAEHILETRGFDPREEDDR